MKATILRTKFSSCTVITYHTIGPSFCFQTKVGPYICFSKQTLFSKNKIGEEKNRSEGECEADLRRDNFPCNPGVADEFWATATLITGIDLNRGRQINRRNSRLLEGPCNDNGKECFSLYTCLLALARGTQVYLRATPLTMKLPVATQFKG